MCNAHIMRCEGVGGKAEVRFFYSLNVSIEAMTPDQTTSGICVSSDMSIDMSDG